FYSLWIKIDKSTIANTYKRMKKYIECSINTRKSSTKSNIVVKRIEYDSLQIEYRYDYNTKNQRYKYHTYLSEYFVCHNKLVNQWQNAHHYQQQKSFRFAYRYIAEKYSYRTEYTQPFFPLHQRYFI